MTDTIRNLQQTCRACLCTVDGHISLCNRVSVCDQEVMLSDIILSCTGVSVNTDDGYPQSLCASCYNDACVAYRFQASCLKSAKILQDELERGAVKIEIVLDPLEDDDKYGIMVPIKDELTDCVSISYNDDLKQLQSGQNTSNIGKPVCKICLTYFTDEISLEHHLENCYRRVGGICGQTFASDYIFNKHALTHEAPSSYKKCKKKSKCYKCKFCRMSYKFPAELRNHVITHITFKHYLCIYCGNKFNLSHRSECKHTHSQHGRKHINKIKNNEASDSLKEQPLFCCLVCNKPYRRQKYFLKHKCKLTRSSYECSHCKKRFNILGNLKMHERIHTGEKPYQCLHCNMRFLRNYDLKRHIFIHTGEQPYQCLYCSKRFNNRVDRNSHERTHTGEKPYKCSHCSKRFVSRRNLTRHTCIHTGEKPCPALLSNERSVQSNDIKKHYLTLPPEEAIQIQPFSCSHCDRCFPKLALLNMHICTSSSEETYECSRCSKRFSQLGQLMSHKLTHLRKI